MQMNIFSPQPKPTEELNWKEVLQGERDQPYFQKMLQFVESERARGKTIYPSNADIFNALHLTPFEQVKVVIIGQDPYHGPNQAHGLCFSVREGVAFPPSLVNIFAELKQDLGIPVPRSGNLERWARQGVLLLNAVLTVEAGRPQSHRNLGWEQFTDRVIHELVTRTRGLVFLLWGADAKRKVKMIDRTIHTYLEAPHPSPLSAHRGFFGCRHFSKCNEALKRYGKKPIDWTLV